MEKLLAKLSDPQKRAIRSFLSVFGQVFPFSSNLSFLARIHQTDKLSHGYIPIYERYFSPIRRRPMNIVEIGIGGYDSPIKGGESLRMWRDYFPRSEIFGIDVYDKSFLNGKRVHTFKGSQCDIECMGNIVKNIGGIDIIIDDGSHISEHVIASFNILFPYLSDGGYYVIEDLHTSYWPQHGGSYGAVHTDKLTSIQMLKMLVDGLNYQYIPERQQTYCDTCIQYIHFYPSIAIMRKGLNQYHISDWAIDQIKVATKGTR